MQSYYDIGLASISLLPMMYTPINNPSFYQPPCKNGLWLVLHFLRCCGPTPTSCIYDIDLIFRYRGYIMFVGLIIHFQPLVAWSWVIGQPSLSSPLSYCCHAFFCPSRNTILVVAVPLRALMIILKVLKAGEAKIVATFMVSVFM
jgi:hypothetical protein